MLKDNRVVANGPVRGNDVRKAFRHILGVIAISMPGALLLFIYMLFGVGKEEAQIIVATVAACLVAGISLIFTRKVWLAYVVAVAPVPALYLAAFLLSGPITRKWTEDVLLDDGSIIQVERTVKFNETNSVSGDAYNAVETDATISFTGEFSKLPPWRAPLMALVMYRDKETKEWVIVATTTSCYVWNMRNEPEPMYWEFRLNSGGWMETPLSDVSIGRPANLLHRYQSTLKTKHITIADRRRIEDDPEMGKEFRTILADDKVNCEKALRK